MNNSGDITNDHGWPVNGLVNLAHSRGVKVIVTVTNFDNAGIGTLLGAGSTPRESSRKTAKSSSLRRPPVKGSISSFAL